MEIFTANYENHHQNLNVGITRSSQHRLCDFSNGNFYRLTVPPDGKNYRQNDRDNGNFYRWNEPLDGNFYRLLRPRR